MGSFGYVKKRSVNQLPITIFKSTPNYKITFDGYDAEHDLLCILKFNIHFFDLSFEVFKIIKVIPVHLKITGCGLPIMNSKIMTKGDAGIFI